ncbi:MAG: acetoacetate decarboxylase (ADC), partial [Pseudomonadales bacterium]|nr:acetoacetate decarboxylase (ADC) [Pseudomonadales bacterium]
KVDVGFETYSPNFFYSNTKITAIFTADMRRLRDLMPAELMHIVQPLEIFPGRGMVAITAYAYHYCDNDFYNEFSVSIVTNRAGRPNHGFISLLAQMDNNDYWGYVLKLPVDTELARVRGVVGYNLPKWLTKMSYSSDEHSVSFQIFDELTGELDLTFEGKVLETSSDVEVVRNNFTNVDQAGNLTRGYTDSRNLAYATSMKGSDVNLTLREGSLSDFIHSLDLGIMIQYEYVPEFQSALYSTEPLED